MSVQTLSPATTRRSHLEMTLRSLSARHSDEDDTWTVHTATRGRAGYLEVLIDDESGEVHMVAMDTSRKVRWSMTYESSVPVTMVASDIVTNTTDK